MSEGGSVLAEIDFALAASPGVKALAHSVPWNAAVQADFHEPIETSGGFVDDSTCLPERSADGEHGDDELKPAPNHCSGVRILIYRGRNQMCNFEAGL